MRYLTPKDDEEYHTLSKIIKKNLNPLSKDELVDLLIRCLIGVKA
jgi:hypothetical protein